MRLLKLLKLGYRRILGKSKLAQFGERPEADGQGKEQTATGREPRQPRRKTRSGEEREERRGQPRNERIRKATKRNAT